MQELVDLAQSLCKRWMPGTREGGSRSAWEHPADVVRVLTEEIPWRAAPAEMAERAVLGWLHDLLEDGVLESGTRVTHGDMSDAGIPDAIMSQVVELTKCEDDKATYLARLKYATPRVRLVKCADRICNLREAAATFSDRRWIRYVGEAYYFIYPLANDLGAEGLWLQDRLVEAVQARRVG